NFVMYFNLFAIVSINENFHFGSSSRPLERDGPASLWYYVRLLFKTVEVSKYWSNAVPKRRRAISLQRSSALFTRPGLSRLVPYRTFTRRTPNKQPKLNDHEDICCRRRK